MFTVGQHVKTRDGRDARVICVDRDWDRFPIVALIVDENSRTEMAQYFNPEGRSSYSDEYGNDLIPPKRSGTFWVNVYQGSMRTTHSSTEDADRYVRTGSPPRFACIEVHWTEGDGL